MPKETDLRDLVQTLDPKTRDDLRRLLIRDDADRDAIASRLMRYRDENGQRWADVIDFLTMYPDARRPVARMLAEIDASEQGVVRGYPTEARVRARAAF